MRDPVQIEMLFAIPFDHDVYIDPDVLSLSLSIQIAGRAAVLEFPRYNQGERALLAPSSAAADVEHYLPDEVWGIYAHQSLVSITSALVRVPSTAVLTFDIDKDQAGGPAVRELQQIVADWWKSFSYWIWIITAQPLNPADPDPKVVNQRSVNVVSRVRHGSKSSLPRVEPSTISITVSGKGPSAERIANSKVMRRAAAAAGADPPLVLEMFASARMAARRGDHRRAIIDVGLVCESALSSLLNQPAGHKLTLGALVTLALTNRLPIPADTKASVVDPRNDAVHRGAVAATSVDRALQISEELISLVEPNHIRLNSLVPVNRPQRVDLMLIKPPDEN